MSSSSGRINKGERGKKFNSLNINTVYHGKAAETFKSSARPQHGMQSLGKVPTARRMPRPVHLPSRKSENLVTDNVNILPSGNGWKKEDASPAVVPQVQPKPAPSQQPQPVPASGQRPTSANTKASWSHVTLADANVLNNREFPELAAGDAKESDYPSKRQEQYGPGPSLRPQSLSNWRSPGAGIRPTSSQEGEESDSEKISAEWNGPQVELEQRMMPMPQADPNRVAFGGKQPMHGHYPRPMYAGGPMMRMAPPPPMWQGYGAPHGYPSNQYPRVGFSRQPAPREALSLQSEGSHADDPEVGGWASHQGQIDYNETLKFSDDEDDVKQQQEPPMARHKDKREPPVAQRTVKSSPSGGGGSGGGGGMSYRRTEPPAQPKEAWNEPKVEPKASSHGFMHEPQPSPFSPYSRLDDDDEHWMRERTAKQMQLVLEKANQRKLEAKRSVDSREDERSKEYDEKKEYDRRYVQKSSIPPRFQRQDSNRSSTFGHGAADTGDHYPPNGSYQTRTAQGSGRRRSESQGSAGSNVPTVSDSDTGGRAPKDVDRRHETREPDVSKAWDRSNASAVEHSKRGAAGPVAEKGAADSDRDKVDEEHRQFHDDRRKEAEVDVDRVAPASFEPGSTKPGAMPRPIRQKEVESLPPVRRKMTTLKRGTTKDEEPPHERSNEAMATRKQNYALDSERSGEVAKAPSSSEKKNTAWNKVANKDVAAGGHDKKPEGTMVSESESFKGEQASATEKSYHGGHGVYRVDEYEGMDDRGTDKRDKRPRKKQQPQQQQQQQREPQQREPQQQQQQFGRGAKYRPYSAHDPGYMEYRGPPVHSNDYYYGGSNGRSAARTFNNSQNWGAPPGNRPSQKNEARPASGKPRPRKAEASKSVDPEREPQLQPTKSNAPPEPESQSRDDTERGFKSSNRQTPRFDTAPRQPYPERPQRPDYGYEQQKGRYERDVDSQGRSYSGRGGRGPVSGHGGRYNSAAPSRRPARYSDYPRQRGRGRGGYRNDNYGEGSMSTFDPENPSGQQRVQDKESSDPVRKQHSSASPLTSDGQDEEWATASEHSSDEHSTKPFAHPAKSESRRSNSASNRDSSSRGGSVDDKRPIGSARGGRGSLSRRGTGGRRAMDSHRRMGGRPTGADVYRADVLKAEDPKAIHEALAAKQGVLKQDPKALHEALVAKQGVLKSQNIDLTNARVDDVFDMVDKGVVAIDFLPDDAILTDRDENNDDFHVVMAKNKKRQMNAKEAALAKQKDAALLRKSKLAPRFVKQAMTEPIAKTPVRIAEVVATTVLPEKSSTLVHIDTWDNRMANDISAMKNGGPYMENQWKVPFSLVSNSSKNGKADDKIENHDSGVDVNDPSIAADESVEKRRLRDDKKLKGDSRSPKSKTGGFATKMSPSKKTTKSFPTKSPRYAKERSRPEEEQLAPVGSSRPEAFKQKLEHPKEDPIQFPFSKDVETRIIFDGTSYESKDETDALNRKIQSAKGLWENPGSSSDPSDLDMKFSSSSQSSSLNFKPAGVGNASQIDVPSSVAGPATSSHMHDFGIARSLDNSPKSKPEYLDHMIGNDKPAGMNLVNQQPIAPKQEASHKSASQVTAKPLNVVYPVGYENTADSGVSASMYSMFTPMQHSDSSQFFPQSLGHHSRLPNGGSYFLQQHSSPPQASYIQAGSQNDPFQSFSTQFGFRGLPSFAPQHSTGPQSVFPSANNPAVMSPLLTGGYKGGQPMGGKAMNYSGQNLTNPGVQAQQMLYPVDAGHMLSLNQQSHLFGSQYLQGQSGLSAALQQMPSYYSQPQQQNPALYSQPQQAMQQMTGATTQYFSSLASAGTQNTYHGHGLGTQYPTSNMHSSMGYGKSQGGPNVLRGQVAAPDAIPAYNVFSSQPMRQSQKGPMNPTVTRQGNARANNYGSAPMYSKQLPNSRPANVSQPMPTAIRSTSTRRRVEPSCHPLPAARTNANLT